VVVGYGVDCIRIRIAFNFNEVPGCLRTSNTTGAAADDRTLQVLESQVGFLDKTADDEFDWELLLDHHRVYVLFQFVLVFKATRTPRLPPWI
jgi:hypothetical protein